VHLRALPGEDIAKTINRTMLEPDLTPGPLADYL